MESRYVQSLDTRMHTVETGRGTPIVFLHGNPTSSYLWRNIMPGLAEHGRCIAPDLPGMGKSDKPDCPYRFFDHARYLDAWFDEMALDEVVLVIHDWGSALGIDWARRHSDRVAGIAMMEPILRNYAWDEFPQDLVPTFQAFRTPDEGERLILEQNMFVEQVLPGAVLRDLSEEEMAVYRKPYPTPEDRRPTLQWPRELPIGGEPADLIERVIEPNTRYLAESGTPKLLLTFEPGILMDSGTVQWLRDTVANLEVQHVGPGLHFVQEDHPEAIAGAIGDWLERTRDDA